MLAGCGGGAASGASQAPKLVPDSALTASLLTADELNSIMATSGMTPHTPVAQMGDHRNLLPNLNCLGVWQVNEAPIYESSHWKSVRQQLVRAPDIELWNFLVVQSIRGTGDQTRSCQRVLSLVANLILDIQACKPQQQSAITAASDVADKIEAKLPR
jgi:hypothetical protein